MTILTLDPNTLYQVELVPAWDPDEPAWCVLGLGPDGVSKALAVILEEFLRPLDNPEEEHYLEFELNSARKQLAELSAREDKSESVITTIDAVKEQIEDIESVLSKAPFIAEVVSSPLSALSAGNFYGDPEENGVEDLFTDGSPRDVLHLLYGFAAALPSWKFGISNPTIYR